MRQRQRAFTLIELLVVIAIIAILAAILFPVFAKAREQARKAACMSNVNQCVKACLMYIQDYDEKFVPQGAGPGNGCSGSACQAQDPLWDCTTAGFANFLHPGLNGQAKHGDAWHGGWSIRVQPYIKNRQAMYCPNRDRWNPVSWGDHNWCATSYAMPWNNSGDWNAGGQNIATVQYPANKALLCEYASFHSSIIVGWNDGTPANANEWSSMTGFWDGHVKYLRYGQRKSPRGTPAAAPWTGASDGDMNWWTYNPTANGGQAPGDPSLVDY